MKPLNNYILIEILTLEQSSGVDVDIKDRKMDKAKVVNAGGYKELKKGDVVYIKDYDIITVNDNNKEYSFVKFTDILAKI